MSVDRFNIMTSKKTGRKILKAISLAGVVLNEPKALWGMILP